MYKFLRRILELDMTKHSDYFIWKDTSDRYVEQIEIISRFSGTLFAIGCIGLFEISKRPIQPIAEKKFQRDSYIQLRKSGKRKIL